MLTNNRSIDTPRAGQSWSGFCQVMSGRQLAEYAFHCGFLSSLLASATGGRVGPWVLGYRRRTESPEECRAKVWPGIEAGPRSVRPASNRTAGRRNGIHALPAPLPPQRSTSLGRGALWAGSPWKPAGLKSKAKLPNSKRGEAQ